MWNFLKIYFKESWLIVYHSPHIDIPTPKGEKIKLLGDTTVFTRTVQKLGTPHKILFPFLFVTGVCRKTKAENVESSTGCTFFNGVLYQGNKMENCIQF